MAGLAAVGAFPGAALASAPARSLRPFARPPGLVGAAPIEALIAEARLGGAVGFAVADATTGEVLEGYNASSTLPPASVAKALTAAYAIDALGPGHHFRTRVIASGPISDGVLNGDLILAGGGDPTLDTDALADLVAQVRARGVTRLAGRLRVWAGALPFERAIDPGQPDHLGYNPALSGLNLNFNRVYFQWSRSGGGYDVTLDARSATHRPVVRMARMAVADRRAPIYTYEARDGQDHWTVARAALGQEGARWLPVRDPALYAGEVFESLARAAGIETGAPVVDTAPPRGTELAAHQSAPLRIILRDMLKWSTNLTAEMVGLAATAARQGRAPDSLMASADAMNGWARARFGIGSVALVDHSGLGDRSRISARDMVQALAELRRSMGIKPLLKPFGMRDGQGRPMPDHPVAVSAKTGTLNFVSGLAGFADLPGGREVVFAVFTADLDHRASLSRAERERPPGARSWNRRAKALQQDLIERWATLYAV